MKKSPVVHFEMSTKDKARSNKFYSEVFGWDMQVMGSDYSGYIVATTTESDEKGPKKPGAINGGFYEETTDSKGTHLVISVDDIEKHVEIVEKAGGEVLGKPMDIPGIGMFVMIKDSEGNKIAMLQPAKM